jgi:hypothetical protein
MRKTATQPLFFFRIRRLRVAFFPATCYAARRLRRLLKLKRKEIK